ncbi:electron transport complex subunit RsxG [Nitrincola tibetensis]|uniref:Ion-translocating oxidoreductase complex subunit G n=1 Tax=Nitrincola tibetensis TaxID=2219697 RepID=A0A364NHX8_9GAMM|nr:electron transport complex subunit RsxG [Nitrincola tibetensis]RAU16729.1 electron transport complex subunit RsxG [Nitrincola tibetensis]
MDLSHSIRKSVLGISIFAAVTAGLIATTQVLTRDKIESNHQEHQARALYEIIPRSLDENLHLNTWEMNLPELGAPTSVTIFRAIQNQEVKGVIIPVTAQDGYSGDIEMLVGIWQDGRVAGVRVLSHKETPGLGDKIELAKSNWILDFNNAHYQIQEAYRWNVRKDGGDFDQFTGATITPRAVVRMVSRTLQTFEQRRIDFLSLPTQDTQLNEARNGN